MFTTAFFWRLIIAVIVVAFVWALIPPVLDLLGLHPPVSLLTIVRLCVAAMACLYVVTGAKP